MGAALMKDEKHLPIAAGTPLTLPCGAVLKNRLVKAAMSEQLADARRNPTEVLCHLYKTWADGGAALLISGNIMVDRRHIGEPKNVVLDEASDRAAFRRWVQAGTQNGAHFWAQLNHPGKQTPNVLTWEPVAPSAIGLKDVLPFGYNRPRALTETEILGIVQQFGHCAALAREVGFTGGQIHAAHGYLINQFLSPAHNRRSDQWGGSLENRMRFLLEIYKAIRTAVGPRFPVAIKLNSADFQNGGFSEEDSIQVVKALSAAGVGLIEISGGTYESGLTSSFNLAHSTHRREAYFLDYADNVRRCTSSPLMVTGGFRSGAGIASALTSGATDLIGLARPLAVEPAFPNHLLTNPAHRIELRTLTSGSRTIDRFMMLNITWYEQQIARLADGLAPKPQLNTWVSIAMTLWDLGLAVFRKRSGRAK